MHTERLILLFVGGMFTIIGGGISLVFIPVFGVPEGLFPLLFVVIGLGLLAIPAVAIIKEKTAWKKGKPYTAKIVGYIEDTSITVNGAYPTNVRIRHFGENGRVCEGIINTRFTSGTPMYAIGTTVDVRLYEGVYAYDPKSIRYDEIENEEVLMGEINQKVLEYSSVVCPNCGASFKAMKGYPTKCPYCDSYEVV